MRNVRRWWPIAVAVMVGASVVPTSAVAANAATTDWNAIAPRQSSVSCGGAYSAVQVTPNASFNPLTATDAELIANGFPKRPTSAADLTSWKTLVGKGMHPAATCAALESEPLSQDQPGGPVATSTQNQSAASSSAAATTTPACLTVANESCNWGGAIANGNYSFVQSDWTVPTGTGPDNAYSSQWIGVGQGQSSAYPLYQAGSEVDDAGARVYFWIETYPQENQIRKFNLAAGDSLWTTVYTTSTGATYEVDVGEPNGDAQEYTYTYSGISSPDGTAEWIDERTASDGYYFEYTKQTVNFVGATAATSATAAVDQQSVPWYNTSHQDKNMYDCEGVNLAKESDVNDSLRVTWYAYGQEDPLNCGQ